MKKWVWRSNARIDTFADAMTFFLARKENQHCSPNTLDAYHRDIKVISAIIADIYPELTTGDPEDIPITYLTTDVLSDAFQTYAANHSHSSHHRCFTTWKGLCTALVEADKIPKNPMLKIDSPRPSRASLPKVYSAHALSQLLAYLEDPQEEDGPTRWAARDRAIFLLLIATGMRAAELRGLTMADCIPANDGTGAIIFRLHGKGNKERMAAVEAPVAEAVTEYLIERCRRNPEHLSNIEAQDPWTTLPRTAPLLISVKGQPMTKRGLEFRVERALRRAGLWEHKAQGTLLHQFRHTFATAMADDPQVTVFQLRNLLGHGSLAATERYTAAAGRGVREVSKRNPVYSMLEDGLQP